MKNNEKKSITFVMPLGYSLLLEKPESGAGGAERQFFLFGKALEKKGWDVSFICDTHSENKKTQFSVYSASFSYMGGSKFKLPFDWWSLIRAMKKADSDYYVVKTPGHLLLPMNFFSKLFSKKTVFWAQMEYDAYPKLRTLKKIPGKIQDIGVRFTDIVLAQNSSQVKGFKVNYQKDSQLIKSIAGKLNQDIADTVVEKFDVLWVGNSLPKKRFEVVIALAKLMPELIFAIAMNRADKGRYLLAQEQSKPLSNVIFLGQTSPDKMETNFSKAKLYLNTSTQEGFPNTFLQAWQVGVPVISLSVDPDNIIIDNQLGMLASENFDDKLCSEFDFQLCANELKTSINRVLTNIDLYQLYSSNSRSYVESQHSEHAVSESLINTLLNN